MRARVLRLGDTEIKFVMLFARMVYYEEIWERSATKAKEWRRNDRKGLQLFIYNREYWVLLGESRAAYIDKREYLHKERHKTKKGRRKSEAPSRSHSQYLIKERKKWEKSKYRHSPSSLPKK